MALPLIPEIPTSILFPVVLILAIALLIFIVRVIRIESKKRWYRSPTFMIPLVSLLLLISFFTFKVLGLVVLLLAVVALMPLAVVVKKR
jgi:bacteriorhodopsin